MMMMMVLCPGAFMPPGNEISEVFSHCLPHRQLWVSNLSMVATQWLEVDSNLLPFGYKAQNMPLHHRVTCYQEVWLFFNVKWCYFVVKARLRRPQDGLFTGVIDALDTANNSYRITFDRTGLGTHSVADIDVLV